MVRDKKIWLLLIFLLGSVLACNLTTGGDDNSDNTGSSETANDTLNVQENTTPPTIQIVSPADEQQVIVDTAVDVRVNATHEVGVQRIQMSVDGNTVSSKSLLENPTDVEVLLSWTPDQRGSFTLEVQAFHGSTGSQPAQIVLQVFPEGSILSNPIGGQAPTAASASGTCTGRILISNLNSRSGAGTNFTKLGKFDVGENVLIIGRDAATEWYEIRRDNGEEVWVINNSDWLETSGDCASVPTTS
ncbi:MAG: Ig-like domain-containing protein [Chloroflexi bacterium]|nr:Ig-like domain-containing protein [Chloroflexota bacterium]